MLTPSQQKLEKYLIGLASQMGLQGWLVRLMPDPCDPARAMEVDVVYARRIANVRVHENWEDFRREEIRINCVHELIHCHIAPMTWAVNNLEPIVGGPVFQLFDKGFEDQMEVAVDNMATAWAELMPLPTFVKASNG